MSSARIESLRGQIGGPRDGALLRFALAGALLDAGNASDAAAAARAALGFDASYTAAWKLLGKALSDAGDKSAAIAAYRKGIQAAEAGGDIQAGKEMQVFLRRLERARNGYSP